MTRSLGRPRIGSTKKQIVSFTLSPEIIQSIKRKAKDSKVSQSEIAESLLRVCLLTKNDILQATLNAYPRITFKVGAIEKLCKVYGISKLSLFGSVLTPCFHKKSDVDVLIEFKRSSKTTLFTLNEIENSLSRIFAKRKIDIKTANDLSMKFRDEVLDSQFVIWEDSHEKRSY